MFDSLLRKLEQERQWALMEVLRNLSHEDRVHKLIAAVHRACPLNGEHDEHGALWLLKCILCAVDDLHSMPQDMAWGSPEAPEARVQEEHARLEHVKTHQAGIALRLWKDSPEHRFEPGPSGSRTATLREYKQALMEKVVERWLTVASEKEAAEHWEAWLVKIAEREDPGAGLALLGPVILRVNAGLGGAHDRAADRIARFAEQAGWDCSVTVPL